MNEANWKVKVHSIAGRNSRSSFKIESSGSSDEGFAQGYRLHNMKWVTPGNVDYEQLIPKGNLLEILTDTSSKRLTRKSDGQLSGLCRRKLKPEVMGLEKLERVNRNRPQ